MNNVNSSMGNIELVYAMFNQYLFQEAKNNIGLVDYYFRTNPATMGNGLISDLLNAIRNFPLESIDEPLFRSILAKEKKSPQECDAIIYEIIKYKMYDKKQIEPARGFLRGICNSSIIKQAENKFPNDPEGFVKYLKVTEYKADHSDIMATEDFSSIDINSMVASNSIGYASHFDWINKAFDPLMKYEAGQLVIVSASPGTGKSLFLMTECLSMAVAGHRCHYIALGDLKPKDFIVRMGAIYSGATFADVQTNLPFIYRGLSNAVGDRLGLSIVPAAKVTADQYIEYIKSKINDYDILFIDYDSNFLSTNDNLYQGYGEIYDRLTELTALGKLVFIASQPKINMWREEIIPLEGVGESSRKQHSADQIITIGRYTGSRNHLGIMKIVKNRRGEVDIEQPYIRLTNGRFIPVSDLVYDTLKNIKEKRIFSESDISQMEKNAEMSLLAAQQSILSSSNNLIQGKP